MTDHSHIVGNLASLGALIIAWSGVVGPVFGLIASCLAIAWFGVLFYDRFHKKRRNILTD